MSFFYYSADASRVTPTHSCSSGQRRTARFRPFCPSAWLGNHAKTAFKAVRGCAATASALFLLLPIFVWATGDDTRAYLYSQSPDAWVMMARSITGDAPTAADVSSLSCDGSLGLAKCILASTAIGKNPKDVFSRDLVATLLTVFDGHQIGTLGALNDDAWAILALRSAGTSINDAAISASASFLLQRQNADGGWGYATPGSSDTNDTAAIVMALLESGELASSPALQKAVAYFGSQQNTDGGFSYDQSQFGASDAASDAWVISALRKMGENVAGWSKSGKTPLDHLNSLRQSDGSYAWQTGQSGTPAITAWAAIALAGQSYPVRSLGGADSGTVPVIRHLGALMPSETATSVYSKSIKQVTVDFSKQDSDRGSDTGTVRVIRRLGAPMPSATATSVLSKKVVSVTVDPTKKDSDGDGFPDSVEVKKGYDPLDPIPCPKRTFSTTTRNTYGGMRLASRANEQCRGDYLKKQLELQLGKTLRVSAMRWQEIVNAYVYGGYSIDAIGAWEDVQHRVISLSMDFGDGRVTRWTDIPYRQPQTVFAILKEQLTQKNVQLTFKPSTGTGVFVQQIGDKKNGDGKRYWTYRVNGEFALVAADRYVLLSGDSIEWTFSKS